LKQTNPNSRYARGVPMHLSLVVDDEYDFDRGAAFSSFFANNL